MTRTTHQQRHQPTRITYPQHRSKKKPITRKPSPRSLKKQLIKLLFGEVVRNLFTGQFLDTNDTFLERDLLLFCRVGRSEKFDACCFVMLNAIIIAMNRLEQTKINAVESAESDKIPSISLVLVLTDGHKRESVMRMARKHLHDSFWRLQPSSQQQSEDPNQQSEASNSMHNVFMYVDQQQETILQQEEQSLSTMDSNGAESAASYFEEDFEPFEQLQRYCLLNLNKFLDCVEYWNDRKQFGEDTPLPPYNTSSAFHLGPSFFLMQLNAKDSCGLCCKLPELSILSSGDNGSLSQVAFKLPELAPQWNESLQIMDPSDVNSFMRYNPRVKKSSDIYVYRMHMRATKARRLKMQERVAKQRFQTLYYDTVEFLKLYPQIHLPKEKTAKNIALLTGEDIPELAPSLNNSIVLLYFAAPHPSFQIDQQDFLPQLISFNEQLSESKYRGHYKIWWIPDLPLDESRDDLQLQKEVNYMVDRFQQLVESHSFEIIDHCYEDKSCVKDLLHTRPKPPILVAINLTTMRHLVAVDYEAGINVDALEHRPEEMLKMWADMLGVKL